MYLILLYIQVHFRSIIQTATYMDITFYYTDNYEGNISFSQSNMIKSMKWIRII